MTSLLNFTNSEGITISITIPYTSHPWWSKKVKAWIHVLESWGFRRSDE